MSSWDDEDFVPEASTEEVITDKWEGEDEDDDVKDNWDDDDDGEEGKDKTQITPSSQPKKKKPLAERIKEKQEKRRQEQLARQEQMKLEEEAQKLLTPEEQLAEQLKNQRLQEESDLELAKEAFGVADVLPGQKTFENFNPTSKEEFNELSTMISQKLTAHENKSEYTTFLENLFRDCCAGVNAEDIKRISNTLTVLANEKQKLSKGGKAGKKKAAGKKTLSTGKAVRNDMDFEDDYYDEYEDFM
ncbi:eukaryotic translation initiation factor 3 subunit J-like isoform X2 [Hydractinia symbiolongicarpus]|uniref:eukaryotic translation initiation factor 3 subunit J-like isoform X2 n=1 Tax=Hydractinia symbiolongicarpus TaxID=13093 RepID=UPI00254EA2AF|nr:eukaryotic translation initiation factor 3 subunit J-like isoform X2 [Hydractinia symbiolongicarpus]